MWAKMLLPAVTHSALIAPRCPWLLAALHQRCHVIVMREELMVKGDTTSLGKRSVVVGDQREGRGAGGCPLYHREVAQV